LKVAADLPKASAAMTALQHVQGLTSCMCWSSNLTDTRTWHSSRALEECEIAMQEKPLAFEAYYLLSEFGASSKVTIGWVAKRSTDEMLGVPTPKKPSFRLACDFERWLNIIEISKHSQVK
jgi:hypothetical protein